MYQKIRLTLRNITIDKRLRYSFFLLSFLPIFIVGILVTGIAHEAIMDKSTKYIVQLVDAVEDNLQNELEDYEALINELMVNPLIQRGFNEYEETTYTERAVLKNEINKIIIPKLSSNPYIRDIKVVNLEDEVIYQHGYMLNDKEHIKTMTRSIQQIGGKVQCFMQPIYGENYIVMSQVINSVYSKEKVGYIMMVLKEDAVRLIYEYINLGEGSNIYLVDAKKQNLSTQFPTDGNRLESDLQRKNTVVRDKIDGYDIDLIATIPHDYLLQEVIQMIRQVVMVVIICFILSIVISKIICRSIIVPLKKLKAYISRAMEEKFNTVFIDNSADELGVLGRNFVEINNEMYGMIKKIEKDEKERRELEINMLQAQINPHFLFNTLNSLRWIAMMSCADSVSEGILALSELLKNTIIQKAEYITIEDELKNVNNYIVIQKLRYGDSFKVKVDVRESLLKCQTLKFILQPIVENAIIHGIRDEKSILNIEISLEEQEGNLVFTIHDDGKGFDTSKMVGCEDKDIKLSGIGIHNVKDRICLNFGEAYGLQIESEVNQGTTVTLHIPKMEVA